MKNILAILLLISSFAFSIEFSNLDQANLDTNQTYQNEGEKVFGYNLFNGSFSKNTQYRYNPEYRISIGDTINIKMWGAFEFETKSTVDSQGNIFIPKVGTIRVLGIRNDQLSKTIQRSIKRVFKKSVFAYADLASYQPVSIFVTGAVNKPGLYQGLSSDSIIQFIDKARGIDAKSGSYRHIKVLRHNKVVYKVDLYDFLINGSLKLFQFRMGDVIVVDSIKYYLVIKGDVKRPYRFELLNESITLKELLKAVLPNPTLTNFTVTRYNKDNKQSTSLYSIKDSLNLPLFSGEEINFISDHNTNTISIKISGEHANVSNLVVEKGTSLKEVFEKINFTRMSDPNSFQLFRESIAKQQKALISAQLDDLEAKTFTAGSLTTDEAIIRKQEAELVLNFIKRARQVKPKGQVIINKDTNLSKVYLEDGDTIYIPKKSRMVIVQGEVMLPTAQTYVESMSIEDYIKSCGGFGYRADKENILVIQRNGKVNSFSADALFSSSYKVKPGDSILVISKVDTKYLQVVKDITQIMYQIAAGTAIVLSF